MIEQYIQYSSAVLETIVRDGDYARSAGRDQTLAGTCNLKQSQRAVIDYERTTGATSFQFF